jgi:hypothetical protein
VKGTGVDRHFSALLILKWWTQAVVLSTWDTIKICNRLGGLISFLFSHTSGEGQANLVSGEGFLVYRW